MHTRRQHVVGVVKRKTRLAATTTPPPCTTPLLAPSTQLRLLACHRPNDASCTSFGAKALMNGPLVCADPSFDVLNAVTHFTHNNPLWTPNRWSSFRRALPLREASKLLGVVVSQFLHGFLGSLGKRLCQPWKERRKRRREAKVGRNEGDRYVPLAEPWGERGSRPLGDVSLNGYTARRVA